ncbi:MAG TPA: hypothetical protein VNR89_16605 [Roseomonas sp.]|nr:hypothetical protein [Roseomonas sp.]
MPSARVDDPWSEVWDAYEARQAAAHPAPDPSLPEAVTRPAPSGWRGPRRLMVAGCLALGALGLSGPAQPALSMAGLALWPDVPSLLGRLDLSSALSAPPPAPRSFSGSVAAGNAEAGRYLAGLAAAVAEGWSDPAALRRMVLARQDLPPQRDAALRPLEAVRSLRPLGWGRMWVEIGPARGPGALGLDLAWQAGGWRVTRLQLLDPPDGPG